MYLEDAPNCGASIRQLAQPEVINGVNRQDVAARIR